MNQSYERALANLKDLVEWGRKQRFDDNEATTRLKAIDRLIFDCLGWNRDEARLEGYQDGEYADYELGPTPFRAVVEAKRSGHYFDLPAGTKVGVMSIPALTHGNVLLDAAIKQASSYCQARGIPIAILSNGHQLLAFFGSRTDGMAPAEGKALVFPSLNDLQREFRRVWDNLSPSGVDAATLERALSGGAANPAPPKLSERIADYPKPRARSALQTNLEVLGGLLGSALRKRANSRRVDKCGTVVVFALLMQVSFRYAQFNCSLNTPYRSSFLASARGYRHSCPVYPANNCADNATVPITGPVGCLKRQNCAAVIYFAATTPLS